MNWALFLCHEAVVRIASSNSPWNGGILREKKPVPQLANHRTVIGVCVDNITVLGRKHDDVSLRCDALQKAFDDAGIPVSHLGASRFCRTPTVSFRRRLMVRSKSGLQ